jgi:hypothetical protein
MVQFCAGLLGNGNVNECFTSADGDGRNDVNEDVPDDMALHHEKEQYVQPT